MRFPHFRHHGRRDDATPSDHPAYPARWADLGDEVEAYLTGRLIEHRRRVVYRWWCVSGR